MRLPALILAATILASCTVPVIVYIDIPERPSLPVINQTEFECLTDDTYVLLVERDVLQKTYIDQVLAIVEAYNEN